MPIHTQLNYHISSCWIIFCAVRYVESGTVLLNCPEPLDVEVILVSWDFYPSASPDEKVVLNNTDMR